MANDLKKLTEMTKAARERNLEMEAVIAEYEKTGEIPPTETLDALLNTPIKLGKKVLKPGTTRIPGYEVGQPKQGTQTGTIENTYSGIKDPALRQRNIQAWNAYNQDSNVKAPAVPPGDAEVEAMELLNSQREAAAPIPNGAITSPEEQAQMDQIATERDAEYGGLGRFNTGNFREIYRQGVNALSGLPGTGAAIARGTKLGGTARETLKHSYQQAKGNRLETAKQVGSELSRRAAGKKPMGIRDPVTGRLVPNAGQHMTSAMAKAKRAENIALGGRVAGTATLAGLGLNLVANPQPQLDEFFNGSPISGLQSPMVTSNPDQIEQQPNTELARYLAATQGIQQSPVMPGGGMSDVPFGPQSIGAPIQAPMASPTAPGRVATPGPTQAAVAPPMQAPAPDPVAIAAQAQQAYYQQQMANRFNPFGSGSGYEDLQMKNAYYGGK